MGEYCPNCGLNKALCEVFTNLLGDPCVRDVDGLEIELKELRDGYDYITARCTDLSIELHELKKAIKDAIFELKMGNPTLAVGELNKALGGEP
jgi:hypothetical protein